MKRDRIRKFLRFRFVLMLNFCICFPHQNVKKPFQINQGSTCYGHKSLVNHYLRIFFQVSILLWVLYLKNLLVWVTHVYRWFDIQSSDSHKALHQIYSSRITIFSTNIFLMLFIKVIIISDFFILFKSFNLILKEIFFISIGLPFI